MGYAHALAAWCACDPNEKVALTHGIPAAQFSNETHDVLAPGTASALADRRSPQTARGPSTGASASVPAAQFSHISNQNSEPRIAPNTTETAPQVLKLGDAPGRPARLKVVAPRDVPHRSLATHEGRAALVHAVAHIEFNAINLALDAALRFPDLPALYYQEWLNVAKEEATHFSLLAQHLESHYGVAYGDFPAHNGLWEMAQQTCDDVLARMALVPRVMEARGLDVTPGIAAKLKQAGDLRAAEILGIILHDEIEHVAIGNRWYAHFCAERGVSMFDTFTQMRERYRAPAIKLPLNLVARLAAGFTEAELEAMST
jgi:uncharacterized ferritin-like protein (DUF455 family)